MLRNGGPPGAVAAAAGGGDNSASDAAMRCASEETRAVAASARRPHADGIREDIPGTRTVANQQAEREGAARADRVPALRDPSIMQRLAPRRTARGATPPGRAASTGGPALLRLAGRPADAHGGGRAGAAAARGRMCHTHTHAARSARERHDELIRTYVTSYGSARTQRYLEAKRAALPAARTERDVLAEQHRFIRSDREDAAAQRNADDAWAVRLARRYYSKLFKEYAVADLSRAKATGAVGMRWRTEAEVISGKGQFVCGALDCRADTRAGLRSYEVPFRYSEAGSTKMALVKLRLCPDCALRLFHKKIKQLKELRRQRRRRRRKKRKHKRKRERREHGAKAKRRRRDDGAGDRAADAGEEGSSSSSSESSGDEAEDSRLKREDAHAYVARVTAALARAKGQKPGAAPAGGSAAPSGGRGDAGAGAAERRSDDDGGTCNGSRARRADDASAAAPSLAANGAEAGRGAGATGDGGGDGSGSGAAAATPGGDAWRGPAPAEPTRDDEFDSFFNSLLGE